MVACLKYAAAVFYTAAAFAKGGDRRSIVEVVFCLHFYNSLLPLF